jgi:hypothetical protein
MYIHTMYIIVSLYSVVISVAEPGAGFDSKGLGLRAQKKLLGIFLTRHSMVKVVQ